MAFLKHGSVGAKRFMAEVRSFPIPSLFPDQWDKLESPHLFYFQPILQFCHDPKTLRVEITHGDDQSPAFGQLLDESVGNFGRCGGHNDAIVRSKLHHPTVPSPPRVATL